MPLANRHDISVSSEHKNDGAAQGCENSGVSPSQESVQMEGSTVVPDLDNISDERGTEGNDVSRSPYEWGPNEDGWGDIRQGLSKAQLLSFQRSGSGNRGDDEMSSVDEQAILNGALYRNLTVIP